MKNLTQYINEWLIKKKVDKVRRRTEILYTPKDKEELWNTIWHLIDNDQTNLNCIDVSNITDMSEVFVEVNEICLNDIKEIDVSEWDVSNVTNMSNMFRGCKHVNCDLSNWDVSNVKDMEQMFYNCENFEGKGLEKWNVSNVKYMFLMFYNCKKLNCNLEKWNVTNNETLHMFGGCTSLKNKPSWYK